MCRHSRTIMVLGTFAVVLGAGAVHAAALGHYPFLTGARMGWDVGYAALLTVSAYAAGLPERATSRSASAGQALAAVAAGGAGMSLLQLVTGSLILPRFVVGVSGLVLLPLYLICAELSLRERALRTRRERILVVAEEEDVSALGADLLDRPEHPARIVAATTLEAAQGRGTESRPLIELAEACRPTVLVLDRRAAADDSVVTQSAVLHERGIRVRTLSLFYEEWMGKLPLGELERVSLMFDIGELHRARYGRLKRILDVCAGVIGALVMVAVIPLVLVANRLGNQGPLFFRQPRVGKAGAVFTMLKFRTCRAERTELEADQSWTVRNDPRVTPVGGWLRRLHIDELPNFVNILRGEMTLVGPRPEQPQYVDELSAKLPFYGIRHLVRPGLTGWAQVNYGYACDQPGALQKLQYDFYYLRHQGLPIDLRVLVRSLRAALWEGR